MVAVTPPLRAYSITVQDGRVVHHDDVGWCAGHTQPREDHELLTQEGPALLAQLQARFAHPIAELVGDLSHQNRTIAIACDVQC